jgi:drug/metabolite transporter (DMT)-like permease
MKYKLLGGLAVQTTIYNILIHHAAVAHYNPNLVLLLGSTTRSVICFVIVFVNGYKTVNFDWKQMFFPSVLSFVKHQAVFLGMVYLEPSLYQMLYQINIIFAALLTPRTLTNRQLLSILVLFLGILTVLYHRDEVVKLPHHAPLEGMVFTVAAAAASAMHSQLVEDVLKSEEETTWVRQLEMSLFGLCFSILSCAFDYSDVSKTEKISNFVLVLVFIMCVGDMTLPFALKYADNVTKSFSDTVATVVSLCLSQLLYHWHPRFGFYIGAVMIFFSAYLFTVSMTPPKVPIQT